MKTSQDGILTSHAGSLPRPDDLLQLFRDQAPAETVEARLKGAVADVVRQQADAGIAVINDGEYGKPMSGSVDFGAWASYAYGRLSGYELRESMPDPGRTRLGGEDSVRFADFYENEYMPRMSNPRPLNRRLVCTGPITYVGQAQVQRDIDNLKAATKGVAVEDVFISAVATGLVPIVGEYYKTRDEQASANAEAMREEYKAITDAGFCVQIDDPILVDHMLFQFSDLPYDQWADSHVEIVNHALQGIPEDKVRYHICWGSWAGPHSTDVPFADVVKAVLKVRASQYSVEAANVRHEHEWKVWRDLDLPDGKTVMPGVVSHKTNVLEHPELVADRIIRYAEAVGRENVVAGTDCGMGGRINPTIAWAKLGSMVEGARLATDYLWHR